MMTLKKNKKQKEAIQPENSQRRLGVIEHLITVGMNKI